MDTASNDINYRLSHDHGFAYCNLLNDSSFQIFKAVIKIQCWVSDADLLGSYTIKTFGWQQSNNRVIFIFYKDGVSFYTYSLTGISARPTGIKEYAEETGKFRFSIIVDWDAFTLFYDTSTHNDIRVNIESYETSTSYINKFSIINELTDLQSDIQSNIQVVADQYAMLSRLSLEHSSLSFTTISDKILVSNGKYTTSTGNNFRKYAISEGDILSISSTTECIFGFYISADPGISTLIGSTFILSSFPQIIIAPPTSTYFMINIIGDATVVVEKIQDTVEKIQDTVEKN